MGNKEPCSQRICFFFHQSTSSETFKVCVSILYRQISGNWSRKLKGYNPSTTNQTRNRIIVNSKLKPTIKAHSIKLPSYTPTPSLSHPFHNDYTRWNRSFSQNNINSHSSKYVRSQKYGNNDGSIHSSLPQFPTGFLCGCKFTREREFTVQVATLTSDYTRLARCEVPTTAARRQRRRVLEFVLL